MLRFQHLIKKQMINILKKWWDLQIQKFTILVLSLEVLLL